MNYKKPIQLYRYYECITFTRRHMWIRRSLLSFSDNEKDNREAYEYQGLAQHLMFLCS